MIKIKNGKRCVALLTLAMALALLCGDLAWAAKPPPPPPPPPPSPSPVPYSIVPLGTLGGRRSTALGINNSAAVVGWAETVAGQAGQAAFLSYVNSAGVRVMVNLNQLNDPDELLPSGWNLDKATDINDDFQIAGTMQLTGVGEMRGYRLSLEEIEGVLTVISFDGIGTGDPEYLGHNATGINEWGHVTGDRYTEGNVPHGYLWDGVEMSDLGSLPGATGTSTNAINNLDEVAGYVKVPRSAGGLVVSPAHAVRSTPDGAQDLGAINNGAGGFAESWANDINDYGVVVGRSSAGTSKRQTIWRAFRYTDASGMVDLGTLGGQDSWAQGINSPGEIVGRAQTAAGDPAIFLHYTDGNNRTGMVNVTASIGNLRDFNINPNLPRSYIDAYHVLRINDGRLICGTGLLNGADLHAFLLIPLTAP